jgi:hypothetical protein
MPTPFDDPSHQAGPYAGLLPSGLPFSKVRSCVVGPDFGELSKYANRLRVNSISLGIIMSPLAQTDLDSERDRRFER